MSFFDTIGNFFKAIFAPLFSKQTARQLAEIAIEEAIRRNVPVDDVNRALELLELVKSNDVLGARRAALTRLRSLIVRRSSDPETLRLLNKFIDVLGGEFDSREPDQLP